MSAKFDVSIKVKEETNRKLIESKQKKIMAPQLISRVELLFVPRIPRKKELTSPWERISSYY